MKISAEIKKAALISDIVVEELSDVQIKTIKNNISEKYTYSQQGLFLWDRLKEAAVITDRDGWQKSCLYH